MNITHVIGTLKKEDGVAQVILALVREANKHNHRSMIITGWAEDASLFPASVIEIPSMVFPLYKEYRLPFPGMRGFEQKLKIFKPDIIHVHSPDTSAWAAVHYAEKYHIPIVATHHTDFSRDLSYYHVAFLRPLVWRLFKNLYNRMGMVTTPSIVTTEELLSKGIKHLTTIPWGVDANRFNVLFRSEEWRKKILNEKGLQTMIILSVSRLAWEKDLRTLAAVYGELRALRSDFAFVVAGDGPARKELERLMPGAIFLGYVEEKELSIVYASSDIFLFPSYRETFGNVTIEAMASGIIPVVANAGGSRTIVRDGENGLLAQPTSVQDFYQKTVMLLDNPTMRDTLRATGLRDAADYSWEHVFEQITDMYNRLIKK